MKSIMNILFVTKGFPSDKDPMTGNYEAVQAHSVAALGHHVSVAYIRWKSLLHIIDRKPIRYRKCGGVDVYEMLGILPRLPFVSKYLNNYKLDRWMMQHYARKFARKFIDKYPQPDIIHIHSQFIAKYAIVMKDEIKVPLVLTEHWSGLNTGSIDKNLLSEQKVYLLSDAVIVVSHALQKALKNFYGVESRVVYNMVEDRFFQEKRRTRQSDTFTFISVGRLVPVKCFDCLVKAVSLMKNSLKIELLLIGEGPEHGKLEQLVEALCLQNRVKLMGLKTPDEVSDILCDADCFVLSSHRETFGIVLIEAMAKGLPVISTRCGGPEDFVNETNGLLVEPDCPENMAKAMDYMVDHAYEYDGEKISQYCFNNFSQEKIGKQIVQVYESVLCMNSDKI